jgi:hypothetical protein
MPSSISLNVLSGNSSFDELPDELDLSELADDMEQLWGKSIARLSEGILPRRKYLSALFIHIHV